MTPELSYLLVGLGNPGREYKDTRHNFGFMLIDRIAVRLNARGMKVQSKAIVTSTIYEDRKLILAKPQTYMNLSGQSVQGLVHFYKIPLTNVMVLSDDLDIPFGTIRIRAAGGPGGQRGLSSVIESLETDDCQRVPLAIRRPPGTMDPANCILQNVSRDGITSVAESLDAAADGAREVVNDGVNGAMNKFDRSLEP